VSPPKDGGIFDPHDFGGRSALSSRPKGNPDLRFAGSPPNSCGDDWGGAGTTRGQEGVRIEDPPPLSGVLVFSEAVLVVVVVVVIEEIMQFGHEQLDI